MAYKSHNKEQVRKRGLPPLLLGWTSGGKPLFLTCSIPSFKFYYGFGGHFLVSSGLFSGNNLLKFGLSRAAGSPRQLIS